MRTVFMTLYIQVLEGISCTLSLNSCLNACAILALWLFRIHWGNVPSSMSTSLLPYATSCTLSGLKQSTNFFTVSLSTLIFTLCAAFCFVSLRISWTPNCAQFHCHWVMPRAASNFLKDTVWLTTSCSRIVDFTCSMGKINSLSKSCITGTYRKKNIHTYFIHDIPNM